jgi:EmrB/QacA subfamily drug resistance transporter
MSQQTLHTGSALDNAPRRSRAPGLSLAVIVACQLMVILDATVVLVALPQIQRSLDFSATALSWVSNGYSLAFGGLLLLGGRAGDILGRRRVFVAGIAVFTVASLLGGLANGPAWLLAARALQGAGAAFAAPSALALIATNFAEGAERNRALSLFTATSAAGASVGLIVGGMLTDWASWRWVLFINVPVGVAVVALAPLVLRETERRPARLDVAGAITSVAGMVALVYAFIRAADAGWGDRYTLGAFVAGVLLLAAFLAIESRAAQPVVPLRLFMSRVRSGAYLIMLLLAAAMFGMFYTVIQFTQTGLGLRPLGAGLAFLPLTGVLFTVARLAPRLIRLYGSRRLMLVGLPIIAVAMLWLTRLSPASGYTADLLGPLVLFGLGAGLSFLPVTVTILSGVEAADSGAASGTLQTMQQTGGALGVAVLVSILGNGGGMGTALAASSALVLAAIVVAATTIRAPR